MTRAIQTWLAAVCAPVATGGLVYGMLTQTWLEVIATLVLFGLAAASLGRG